MWRGVRGPSCVRHRHLVDECAANTQLQYSFLNPPLICVMPLNMTAKTTVARDLVPSNKLLIRDQKHLFSTPTITTTRGFGTQVSFHSVIGGTSRQSVPVEHVTNHLKCKLHININPLGF